MAISAPADVSRVILLDSAIIAIVSRETIAMKTPPKVLQETTRDMFDSAFSGISHMIRNKPLAKTSTDCPTTQIVDNLSAKPG